MEINNKKALVIGGGGFIGHNLVKSLKKSGWWVKAVDLHKPFKDDSPADEFQIADASKEVVIDRHYERIYQLAADMGGAGFVFTGDNDAEILSNSVAININVLRQVKEKGCGTIFYSSSVCMYSSEAAANRASELMAYPANPDSDYGWEKLYSERLYLAYARNYGINVRIARFNNTYGPYGVYEGGREKAPAAMCRKVIMADGEMEVWGDGTQIREFIFIEDLLSAIECLLNSSEETSVNIGPDESVTVDQLAETAIKISGKSVRVKHVDGPIGLQNRLTDNSTIKSLGWAPKYSLTEGMKITYDWIKSCIDKDVSENAL